MPERDQGQPAKPSERPPQVTGSARWSIKLATRSSIFGTVTEQWAVVDEQRREICRTSGLGDDFTHANLIAAAPQMRAALEAVSLEPYADSDLRSLLETLRKLAQHALSHRGQRV